MILSLRPSGMDNGEDSFCGAILPDFAMFEALQEASELLQGVRKGGVVGRRKKNFQEIILWVRSP